MSTNSLSWKDEIGLVTISRTLVECGGDMRHLNEESSSPKNRVLFSQGPTPTHWTPAAPRVQNVVAAGSAVQGFAFIGARNFAKVMSSASPSFGLADLTN